MELIRCKVCGKEIEADEKFCYFCGNIIDEEYEIEEESLLEDPLLDETIKDEEDNNIDIILSTTPTLEGYYIEKYIDVISEELVFKTNILSMLKNSVVDFFQANALSGKELTGSSDTLKKAREFAKRKLVKSAVDLGANAIVGMDYESSVFDSSFAKVSINGTAVFCRKRQEI